MKKEYTWFCSFNSGIYWNFLATDTGLSTDCFNTTQGYPFKEVDLERIFTHFTVQYSYKKEMPMELLR